MVEPDKLRIIIPKNQRTTRDHLSEAGLTPVFEPGELSDDDPRGSELDRGIIEQTGDEIIKIRSRDIPRMISFGYGQIALVGSDCVAGRYRKHIEILDRFPYGRKWATPQPRVEIVAHGDSSVTSIGEIKPGSIFLLEPQHLRLVKTYLEKQGFKVIREGFSTGPEFHKRLKEENSVGISQIGGAGPVLLDDELHFAVMVNEEGTTVSEYNLKVIDKVCDIETLLITNTNALENQLKGKRIMEIREELVPAYERIAQWISREFETSSGREREPRI